MKQFLFSFLLATGFLVNTAFANDDVHKIRLSGFPITILLKGYFAEQVINAQEEDTIIGFVQTGMANKRRLASFGTSISDELSHYLKIELPPTQGAIPLIIRVNKLYIYEVNSATLVTACAELNLSFIRRDGDRFIHLFDAGCLIQQEGSDVTHSHPENIARAILTCFADLRTALLTNRADNHEIPKQELSFNPLKDPSSYAIFQTGKISKGIFRTFYDFRDFSLDTTIHFKVHYVSKKDTNIRKAQLSFTGPEVAEKIWGFSDGKNVYMNIANNFYLLYQEQHRFISHVAYQDIKDDLYLANMVGGLIGGLIVGLTNNGLTDPSEDGYFRVNFCNGKLISDDKPELMEMYTKTLFHLSGNTDVSKSVCLFVNGEFHASLKGGQFYALMTPPGCRSAVVEIRTDENQNSIVNIPLSPFHEYLYYVHLSEQKGIVLNRLKEDMQERLISGMSPSNTVGRSTSCTEHGTR